MPLADSFLTAEVNRPLQSLMFGVFPWANAPTMGVTLRSIVHSESLRIPDLQSFEVKNQNKRIEVIIDRLSLNHEGATIDEVLPSETMTTCGSCRMQMHGGWMEA